MSIDRNYIFDFLIRGFGLKFVGHFHCPFDLLPRLPAVSALAALRCVKTKAARAQGAPNAAAPLNTRLETVVNKSRHSVSGAWLQLIFKDHKSRARINCRCGD